MNDRCEHEAAAKSPTVRECVARSWRSARSRKGSTLVFAAILLFVFFAIAALVIDLGLAQVTRARMVSAADSTALEGLRWRDQFPDNVTDVDAYVLAHGGDPGNAADVAAARDRARREQAAALASIAFADNEPPQPGDGRFGAGPQFLHQSGTIGAAELNAGETLLPGDPTVYKPRLQLNDAMNLPNGDVVAGVYNSDVAASHRDGGTVSGNPTPFAREDFAVSAPATAPASASFLVRMRHSRDDVVDGVASTGPTLPYLFARGAFLPGTADAAGYAPRRDGITVRATAIANAMPVVFAGPPIDTAAVAGTARIAFTRDFWENALLPVNDAGQAAPVQVTLSGTDISSNGVSVGMLLDNDVASIGLAPAPGLAALPPVFRGYVPIIQEIPAGTLRVIGFGWAEVDLSGTSATVTKLSKAGGAIAPRNASADLRLAWAALGPPVLSDADRAAVRNANATLKDPLLAPVLVRSTGD